MYVYRSAYLLDVNAALFIPLSAARDPRRPGTSKVHSTSERHGRISRGDPIGGCPPCLSPDWPWVVCVPHLHANVSTLSDQITV